MPYITIQKRGKVVEGERRVNPAHWNQISSKLASIPGTDNFRDEKGFVYLVSDTPTTSAKRYSKGEYGSLGVTMRGARVIQ